jgi:hypothetical protein
MHPYDRCLIIPSCPSPRFTQSFTSIAGEVSCFSRPFMLLASSSYSLRWFQFVSRLVQPIENITRLINILQGAGLKHRRKPNATSMYIRLVHITYPTEYTWIWGELTPITIPRVKHHVTVYMHMLHTY